MGYPSRKAPGSLVGAISFTAANPPVVVGDTYGGLSVTRGAAGQFSVAFPATQEIDTTNRNVQITRRGAVAAFASELDAGSDSEINVVTQDLAGADADTGDTVSVAVFRTNVG